MDGDITPASSGHSAMFRRLIESATIGSRVGHINTAEERGSGDEQSG